MRRSVISPVVLLLILLLVAACNNRHIAIPAPENPETVALALYGGFVIAEEVAASIAEDPTTPAGVRAALIEADERAAPVAAQLRPAAQAVQNARTALAAGAGTQEQLIIAIQSLNQWIDEAAPLIQALTNLVTGSSR